MCFTPLSAQPHTKYNGNISLTYVVVEFELLLTFWGFFNKQKLQNIPGTHAAYRCHKHACDISEF